MTRKEIMELYQDKGYNTTQVAKILLISRRSMYNFLDNKIPQAKRKRYIKLIERLKPRYDVTALTLDPTNAPSELYLQNGPKELKEE